MSSDKPRILIYDIESSPNIAYTWGKYEQNTLGAFIKERMMITVAWKWLGERKIYSAALPDFKSYDKDVDWLKCDNRELVEKFHSVIGEADIAIAHNGIRFDERRLRTEFLRHGFTPPPPHKIVDTLRAARTHFDLNSNKLGDLATFLNVGTKLKHEGFDMWVGCMHGDMNAWRKMVRYNIQDVAILERVYLKLRPWMPRHPDLAYYSDGQACSSCGKINLTQRGWIYLATGRKRRYMCKSCGKWSSGRVVEREKGWKKRGRI